MKTTDHVNLRDPHQKRAANGLNDFGNGHFERMRITFPSAEGTKLAGENADVGVIDVAIEDVSGTVPVFSFTNDVGDQAERVDVGGPVQTTCFAVAYSFCCDDLIVD